MTSIVFRMKSSEADSFPCYECEDVFIHVDKLNIVDP